MHILAADYSVRSQLPTFPPYILLFVSMKFYQISRAKFRHRIRKWSRFSKWLSFHLELTFLPNENVIFDAEIFWIFEKRESFSNCMAKIASRVVWNLKNSGTWWYKSARTLPIVSVWNLNRIIRLRPLPLINQERVRPNCSRLIPLQTGLQNDCIRFQMSTTWWQKRSYQPCIHFNACLT